MPGSAAGLNRFRTHWSHDGRRTSGRDGRVLVVETIRHTRRHFVFERPCGVGVYIVAIAAHFALYRFHVLKRFALTEPARSTVIPDVEPDRRVDFVPCAVVRPTAIHDHARLLFRSAIRCVCSMFILFPDRG